MVLRPVKSAYWARRVNSTTFLIIHNDKYDEKPLVYAKVYDDPFVIVLFDSGCGPDAAADNPCQVTDLRAFLEGISIEENGNRPLNPAYSFDGRELRQREYIVILTHCHYDHIGGMDAFDTSTDVIFASGYDRLFASNFNRAENSLCKAKGIPVPIYSVWKFLEDGENVSRNQFGWNDKPLGLRAIQTPGHTPDSLTVYDEHECTFYTGDSFYWRWCDLPNGRKFEQAIIFPPQGNWTLFLASLRNLIIVVKAEQKGGQTVKISCSHTSPNVPALNMLQNVISFFSDILDGEIPVAWRKTEYDETFAMWQSQKPPLSVWSPERLMKDAKMVIATHSAHKVTTG